MSANLDLVRSVLVANERGDYSSTDWAHPEIEFVIADGPEPGSWKGLVGMGEGWRSWASAWKEVRTQADEYRELDDERVLVLVRRSGSGKTSGLELEQMRSQGAAIFYVSGGRVTRLVVYVDRDHALGELRLEGYAMSQEVLGVYGESSRS